MREYPREVESQNIYRGLSADILYGNVLDTASPQELRKLSRSEISPDAKALVKLKLSSAPLRAEIDPQSIPKQLLKALPTSKAPSHLTPDQVAKAFEVSPEQAKEALGVVQEALGKPSDRSHASAKKQRKQETSFKRWLDGRYEGIGIQNPNPGLKDPIDPDTLLTYAGNSDYEFQRNAIRIKKQLWDQWWQESEEKRKAEASQLRDQIRAYTPRSVHPDAKVENPENIGPDALVNKDAVVSGDAQVRNNAVVTGNAKISGDARVTGDTEVTGGKISGDAKVSGEARVSGNAKISGGLVEKNATVSGGEISGNAKVKGNAVVTGGEIIGGSVRGNALVSGNAKISGGEMKGKAQVTGGKISGGVVSDDAMVTGGKISGGKVVGEAVVSGGTIWGGEVKGKVQVTGGTISGGEFGGDCKIHGGDWDKKTLSAMRSMPEYKEHFRRDGALISGEWDDVPDDVKKKLEPFGPTGKHPDAKIENPKNIGSGVLVGKDAVISGNAKVRNNAIVTGGVISGGLVENNAQVSGGEISSGGYVLGNAQITGGEISGKTFVTGNAQVTGGTISGGRFGGDCKIRGGDWNRATLSVMEIMPEYEKHFNYEGVLISGEWDDVPEDVKKRIEDFGPTGKHPDAKIENPKNIGPYVLVGKDAEISGERQRPGGKQRLGKWGRDQRRRLGGGQRQGIWRRDKQRRQGGWRRRGDWGKGKRRRGVWRRPGVWGRDNRRLGGRQRRGEWRKGKRRLYGRQRPGVWGHNLRWILCRRLQDPWRGLESGNPLCHGKNS
jgi:acyl-[acyl carrier protein]--UDP-N-acetylglucosamine O-acyltransferase